MPFDLREWDPNGPAMTPAQRRQVFGVPRGARGSTPVPMGYAGTPGTGPTGETCKTCRHIERHRFSKTYLKCGLFPAQTHGRKTDIKAGSPACSKWEQS